MPGDCPRPPARCQFPVPWYRLGALVSRPCWRRRLRTESRVTGMARAMAKSSRPISWPPTGLVLWGKDAATLATGTGGRDRDASGKGEIFGKITPRFATGPGRTGRAPRTKPPGRNTPAASVPGGSASATPGGAGAVPGLEAAGVGFAVTTTLPEADAETAACGEAPAAVTVIRVPAAFFGTATAACSSTGRPARRTTEQATV